MLQKRDFVTFSVAIYTILLILFFAMQDKPTVNRICLSNDPCVRVCCGNQKTCNEKFLRDNFDASLLPVADGTEYKVLFGKPEKFSLQTKRVDSKWNFREVCEDFFMIST
jgi:hypothetical protein